MSTAVAQKTERCIDQRKKSDGRGGAADNAVLTSFPPVSP